MAAKIMALISNPSMRKQIEANSREASLRYGWREIALKQSRLYDDLSRIPA
jgi:hypothetical protein